MPSALNSEILVYGESDQVSYHVGDWLDDQIDGQIWILQAFHAEIHQAIFPPQVQSIVLRGSWLGFWYAPEY
jgi:hypothetical protein